MKLSCTKFKVSVKTGVPTEAVWSVFFCSIITGITCNVHTVLELDLHLSAAVALNPLRHLSSPDFEPSASATWQQPLELICIRVMYSVPFSCMPSRATNFLLLGYINCSINILHGAATGSWSSSRHRWSLQARLITTERLCTLCLSLWNTCNFVLVVTLLFRFLFSLHAFKEISLLLYCLLYSERGC